MSRNMQVDPNRKWTTIYHVVFRQLILIIYPLILFILFYVSLLGGATGIDWSKFGLITKSYNGLIVWYIKYWSYLKAEDNLNFFVVIYDLLMSLMTFIYLLVLNYLYYPLYKEMLNIKYFFKRSILEPLYLFLINLPWGFGDFFYFYFLVMYYFMYIVFGLIKFLYLFIEVAILDCLSLIYLILVEEIFYNYLIAVAFYTFSHYRHSGGSLFLSFRRFLSMLPRGLSIGAYGVHFQPSLENSWFGRFFRLIKRGPYMWKNEEPKLSIHRLDHFLRVVLLRFLVVFYFFLPDGEKFRRRSVLWQLLISDLAEDRQIDFSLTPGLRYQIPLYFFIYSNFFAIDVQEYSEIQFHYQQERLIYFLWCRRKYFNKLKDKYLKYVSFIINYFTGFGRVLLNLTWWFIFGIYFIVYFVRSLFVMSLQLVQIFVLNIGVLVVYLIRLFYILQINSVLYLYRKSFLFAKLALACYDLILGIFFFFILFTLLIAPSYYYLVQMLWGMGGILLAYFYVIWLPLLLLAGIFDEWKIVLHELGEWLFVVCFHMGGWSAVCLRIEINPRFWFMEPEYEVNYYGPMAQEYQGFYLVYAGWFMDALYEIFLA